jgi:hypothetical protein
MQSNQQNGRACLSPGITGGKPANFPSTISSGLAIVLALMISLLGQTL